MIRRTDLAMRTNDDDTNECGNEHEKWYSVFLKSDSRLECRLEEEGTCRGNNERNNFLPEETTHASS